ncbi:MAG: carboxypeptidase regulatory-like domain-containing protein [Ignavibacteriales bacterium]|nr:carboxypeptidase regulatory-like domain-containing protein [Ignavibacteriales bacterium]
MRKVSLLVLALVATVFSLQLLAQPEPPTNLAALATISTNHGQSFGSVKLTWDYTITGTTNAVKYNVYKKVGAIADTTSYKKIASKVWSKTFFDRSVLIGAKYSYKVTAVTAAGESAASNEVEVTLVAVLVPGKGTITGKITDEATGNPIRKAYINFFLGNAFSTVITYTDSLGNYKVKLTAGKYRLYTSGPGFVPEYYNNHATLQLADTIIVAENDSLSIDVALSAIVPPVTNTLSGSVKDASGNAVKSVVTLYKLRANSHFHPVKSARVDSLGNFSVTVKQGDTVVAFVAPQNHWDWYSEFYNNKTTITEADRIAITGNITGIDFVLDHKPVYPNGISGVVKDSLETGVLAAVHAFPKKAHNPGVHGFRTYNTISDSLGVYSFSNFIPAQYYLLAVPKAGYKPSYFRYDGVPTMNWRNADSIVVDSASLVTGINVIVKACPDSGFANIVGTVRDGNGKVVIGAFVYAYNGQGEIYAVAITNSVGKYTMVGLVPDDYMVISDKDDYEAAAAQMTTVNYSSSSSATLDFTITPATTNAVQSSVAGVVADFALSQNYPNPFNPSTTISYQIPVDAKVVLKVYNVLGKEVVTLVNGTQVAGQHSIKFNASALPSGVYIYKLEAGNFSSAKKLVLMK